MLSNMSHGSASNYAMDALGHVLRTRKYAQFKFNMAPVTMRDACWWSLSSLKLRSVVEKSSHVLRTSRHRTAFGESSRWRLRRRRGNVSGKKIYSLLSSLSNISTWFLKLKNAWNVTKKYPSEDETQIKIFIQVQSPSRKRRRRLLNEIPSKS